MSKKLSVHIRIKKHFIAKNAINNCHRSLLLFSNFIQANFSVSWTLRVGNKYKCHFTKHVNLSIKIHSVAPFLAGNILELVSDKYLCLPFPSVFSTIFIMHSQLWRQGSFGISHWEIKISML